MSRTTSRAATAWQGWKHGLLAALVTLALLLAACSPGAATTLDASAEPRAPNIPPDVVVKDFLEDLNMALKDPSLANDARRQELVARLADYFAPNEREEQRITIGTSLDRFVHDLADLQANETVLLEVRYDAIETVSMQSDRALVRLVNGSLYLLIDGATTYEQRVPLGELIGQPDGTLPLVRFGSEWFLTEG